MPRRHRRRAEPQPRETRTPRTTSPLGAPEGWTAQIYHGGEPGPDYTCPRCRRGVSRRSEHVVAWLEDSDEQHRHWHKACWQSAVREGIDRYRWG
ncbi:MAG TPA: hypothetical protein VFA34_01090 [Actinomycetota bacterium]|nr:hypothetical protein [Actinomycetota bacterium]